MLPKRPGTDYMGILRHEHVTDQFLEMYRQEGQAIFTAKGNALMNINQEQIIKLYDELPAGNIPFFR